MNIGQLWSTSPRCGMIKLIGGPYDGATGLFDHNDFDCVCFTSSETKPAAIYKPKRQGYSWDYVYQQPATTRAVEP